MRLVYCCLYANPVRNPFLSPTYAKTSGCLPAEKCRRADIFDFSPYISHFFALSPWYPGVQSATEGLDRWYYTAIDGGTDGRQISSIRAFKRAYESQ